MPDIQISGLTTNPSPALTDVFAVDNSGHVTYKESLGQVVTLFENTLFTWVGLQTFSGGISCNAFKLTATPTAGYVLTCDSAGNGTWQAAAGGSPGGASGDVQFNNSSSFGGSGNFTWNGTTVTLSHTYSVYSDYLYWGDGSVIGTLALINDGTNLGVYIGSYSLNNLFIAAGELEPSITLEPNAGHFGFTAGQGVLIPPNDCGFQIQPGDGTGLLIPRGNSSSFSTISDGLMFYDTVNHALCIYNANTTALMNVTGPAGADTQIQYNAANYLGASSNFVFNYSTNVLTLAGGAQVTSLGVDYSPPSTGALVVAGQIASGTSGINSGNQSGYQLIVTSGQKLTTYLQCTASQGVASGVTLAMVQNDGSAITSGNRLGILGWEGSVNTLNNLFSPVALAAFAGESWSATQYGAYLSFYTTATGGTSPSRLENMRLTALGGLVVGNANLSAGSTAGIVYSTSISTAPAVSGSVTFTTGQWQNTLGYDVHVVGTCSSSTTASFALGTGSATGPSTNTFYPSIASGNVVFSAHVPNGYYLKIVASAGTLTISDAVYTPI